jgi:protein-L-isoaspartate(D-aspartate) O-methyltransferase
VIVDAESTDKDYAVLRHRMVKEQLRRRGIADEGLLAAMEAIPRHLFVPAAQRRHAYDDAALPIAFGQTISQPYIVARMTELLSLTKSSRVLEIGTGSGYQAAVLAELAGEVLTVERIPEIARQAEDLLARLGYDIVRVIAADGTLGFAEAAPYDAILVTAAGPRVPEGLRGQLAIDGRMVIPVAGRYSQELLLVERLEDAPPAEGADGWPAPQGSYRETTILGCVFVPLIGAEGYKE